MILINYIAAVVFTALWTIGFFMRIMGSGIHLLLFAAFALLLINIFLNHKRPDKNNKPLMP